MLKRRYSYHGNRFWSLPRFLRQQKWGVKWLKPESASAPDFGHLLQSFFLTSNWVCGLTRWAVRRQTHLCYSELLRVLLPLKSTGARGNAAELLYAVRKGRIATLDGVFSRGNDYSRLRVSLRVFQNASSSSRENVGIWKIETLLSVFVVMHQRWSSFEK